MKYCNLPRTSHLGAGGIPIVNEDCWKLTEVEYVELMMTFFGGGMPKSYSGNKCTYKVIGN